MAATSGVVSRVLVVLDYRRVRPVTTLLVQLRSVVRLYTTKPATTEAVITQL